MKCRVRTTCSTCLTHEKSKVNETIKENMDKYSISRLEKCAYRVLQQKAKAMRLPSNVKKVHLVNLIHTKATKSELDVEMIIQQVKLERNQMAELRKLSKPRRVYHLQRPDVSSTSESLAKSPPMSLTPKCDYNSVPCNPIENRSIIKYKRKLLTSPDSRNSEQVKTFSQKIPDCDRVLRKRTFKETQQNTYKVFNVDNRVIVKISPEKPKQIVTRQSGPLGLIDRQDINKPSVVKHRSSILAGSSILNKGARGFEAVSISSNCENDQSVVVRKTKELTLPSTQTKVVALSKVCSVNSLPTTSRMQYQYIHSHLGFRNIDGTYATINAFIQRPLNKSTRTDLPLKISNKENKIEKERDLDLTIQDIIDSTTVSNIRNSHTSYTPKYLDKVGSVPIEACLSITSLNYTLETPMSLPNVQNQITDLTSYCHKKIRAEQVRFRRESMSKLNLRSTNENLPKIQDVFSSFNIHSTCDVGKPIYVQANDGVGKVHYHPQISNNATMLEVLYNFKNEFVTNKPLTPISTTSNTKCVYTTSVVATAKAHETASAFPTTQYNNDFAESVPSVVYKTDESQYLESCEQDIAWQTEMSHCQEPISPQSDYSLEMLASQVEDMNSSDTLSLGANVTIPDMVEDALEIISQDGDYMERIGMDVRMQCVLCSWAGPKIIMEHHIRREHSNRIHKFTTPEWNITVTLGSLVKHRHWQSEVIDSCSGSLYVLSTNYTEPDCLRASLSSLSPDEDNHTIGTITIYNKVTGEPFSWAGVIPSLPLTLPYENDSNCLSIKLSKLNLLPNSANLKLFKGELVTDSPNKVVCGQPELDDIHIILFVKI